LAQNFEAVLVELAGDAIFAKFARALENTF